ncbi:FtsH protease activity modulator HflK [Phenylobacterium sp.]|jgi:membrane protease subunit HflK|uniref:FtsH protease activity modulator HflK n=1 Tax=Phenylobacterium sp. TaxID=1871053 RepID=UPI002F400F5E
MPWNDNANPGPWGSPPPGDDDERKDPPRRGSGGRGPGRPGGPDLNAGMDRVRQRMRGLFGGPGGGVRPGALVGIAAAVFALWALSGIYLVQPNEVAVVTTFGAYSRNEGPGPRYHLPWPIEKVEKVPVTTLNRFDIGSSGGGGGASSDASVSDAGASSPSLMLTADEAIIDLNFSVTWRISDPGRFIFATRDPEDAIKAVAESSMREVVGRNQLDFILNNGRGKVQFETADQMQRILDAWGMGVRIVEVQIRSANPPQEVVAAFRDVQSAQQDRDSAENVADAYKNRVVNEAKGTAAQIVQSAEGYREQSVRTATGEAARFNSIYAEYRRAPQATRDRLYLETMERVLRNSNKVVISGKGVTAPVILPPDVFRPRSGPAALAPSAPTQPSAQGGQPQATQPGGQP